MSFQTQSDRPMPRLPEGASEEQDMFNRAVLEILTDNLRNTRTDLDRLTGWSDLMTPISGVRLPASASPTWTTYKSDFEVLAFSASADNYVHFTAQMPHGFKYNTNVDPHVHWIPETSATGNVIWQLDYMWQDIDDVYSAGTTLSATINVIANSEDTHLYSEIGEIDSSAISVVSSMFICRLARLGSSDTYTGKAFMLEHDFHLFFDSLGSDQELVKNERG